MSPRQCPGCKRTMIETVTGGIGCPTLGTPECIQDTGPEFVRDVLAAEKAITLRLQDEQETHYQPAGKTTVCGAIARHMERLGGSPVGVLKIKKTTDVELVTCPGCMGYLFTVVRRFKNPEDSD